MAYPRRCPICEGDYRGSPRIRGPIGVAREDRHMTLSAEPGGTPSPWRPTLPGRLLALRCRICHGQYGWDYFGGRPAEGAVSPIGLAPANRLPRQTAPPRRRHLVLPGSRVRS